MTIVDILLKGIMFTALFAIIYTPFVLSSKKYISKRKARFIIVSIISFFLLNILFSLGEAWYFGTLK